MTITSSECCPKCDNPEKKDQYYSWKCTKCGHIWEKFGVKYDWEYPDYGVMR